MLRTEKQKQRDWIQTIQKDTAADCPSCGKLFMGRMSVHQPDDSHPFVVCPHCAMPCKPMPAPLFIGGGHCWEPYLEPITTEQES